MTIGASSACFYPDVTENSLERLGRLGIKTAELFLNSPSELKDEFVKTIIDIKNKYGINIVSLHPFQSFAESFYLFSNYERRFTDSLPLYERFFDVTHKLGADICVFHGAKIPGSISDGEYFERFKYLTELGKKYSIHVCHENVVYYRGESPEYLKRMRDYIGGDFGVVLDIKQAYRAHYEYTDFINAVGASIRHVHISDHNSNTDCIPPLTGDFDFKKFFNDMKAIGYDGNYIIEIYDWSYSEDREIAEAKRKLEGIIP